jgi:hypothetical protein
MPPSWILPVNYGTALYIEMKKKTTRDGLVKIDLDHKNIDLKRLHYRSDLSST